VRAAMQHDARVLQFASNELRDNHDFMLEAIEIDSWLLQYASEDLKNNKSIALAIVKENSSYS